MTQQVSDPSQSPECTPVHLGRALIAAIVTGPLLASLATISLMMLEVRNPIDLATIFAYGFFFGTLYSGPISILIFLPIHLILQRYRCREWWAYAATGIGIGLLPSALSGHQGLFLLAQIFVPLSLASTLAFWWVAIRPLAQKQNAGLQEPGA